VNEPELCICKQTPNNNTHNINYHRLMKKNIIALAFSLVVSIALLEIFLNIYNPFAPRIQGDQIILPVNKIYNIENDKLSRLDKNIIHTKNGLGFRGPEAPANLSEIPSLLCVGGSTTECYYLNDQYDWPAQLFTQLKDSISGLWINNAGLDGHSTWGHHLLLNQHIFKLKPRYILMLCGVNDLGRNDISEYDLKPVTKEDSYTPGIREWIIRKSQILSTTRTIKMSLNAQKQGVSHENLILKEQEILEIPVERGDSILSHHYPMIEAYGKRLEGIMEACKKNQINLILLTQPMLWGDVQDSLTGVYLGNLKLNDSINSNLKWKIMESYNERAKNIALQQNIPVIDLANLLEKNSLYYYDGIHFTNEGSQRIATLISPGIKSIIRQTEIRKARQIPQ